MSYKSWLKERIKIYEGELNKVGLNEYQHDFYSGKLEAFETCLDRLEKEEKYKDEKRQKIKILFNEMIKEEGRI